MSRILYLFVAAALFALTLTIAYGTWYAFIGRRIKIRKKERTAGAAATGNGDESENKGRKKKDSYCYPSINDIMGYEFVKVVDVDEGLLGITAGDEEQKKASSSNGVGTKTVSVTTVSDESERERAIREIEQSEEGNRIGQIRGEEKRRPPQETRSTQEENAQAIGDETEPSVAPEDIEDLNRSQEWLSGNWSNREYDDDSPSDEEFKSMIEANPDVIVDPSEEELERQYRIAEENKRIARMEEFNRRLEKRSKTVNHDIGADIMDQLAGMADSTEDEGGDGSGNTYIQDDELPEI